MEYKNGMTIGGGDDRNPGKPLPWGSPGGHDNDPAGRILLFADILTLRKQAETGDADAQFNLGSCMPKVGASRRITQRR